uniref:Uncharacterized protein n=1 Tax=Anguilla anguilla TaxID=7936 RepID=A0A0E9XDW8_ANGAN
MSHCIKAPIAGIGKRVVWLLCWSWRIRTGQERRTRRTRYVTWRACRGGFSNPIQCLDGQSVIHGKFICCNVPNWTLVIGPHDGRIRRRMGETQGMAKLMYSHCE